ncbi:hypothetical protein HYQ46_008666 [Verticillium longisporum]|nr:hypothetical protein HYQ46_008666 [Verticillium longisporum]
MPLSDLSAAEHMPAGLRHSQELVVGALPYAGRTGKRLGIATRADGAMVREEKLGGFWRTVENGSSVRRRNAMSTRLPISYESNVCRQAPTHPGSKVQDAGGQLGIASQRRFGVLNAGDACVGEGVGQTTVSHLLAENILTFVAGGWWCGSGGWRGKGALEGSGVAGSGHKQGKTNKMHGQAGEVGCLGR